MSVFGQTLHLAVWYDYDFICLLLCFQALCKQTIVCFLLHQLTHVQLTKAVPSLPFYRGRILCSLIVKHTLFFFFFFLWIMWVNHKISLFCFFYIPCVDHEISLFFIFCISCIVMKYLSSSSSAFHVLSWNISLLCLLHFMYCHEISLFFVFSISCIGHEISLFFCILLHFMCWSWNISLLCLSAFHVLVMKYLSSSSLHSMYCLKYLSSSSSAFYVLSWSISLSSSSAFYVLSWSISLLRLLHSVYCHEVSLFFIFCIPCVGHEISLFFIFCILCIGHVKSSGLSQQCSPLSSLAVMIPRNKMSPWNDSEAKQNGRWHLQLVGETGKWWVKLANGRWHLQVVDEIGKWWLTLVSRGWNLQLVGETCMWWVKLANGRWHLQVADETGKWWLKLVSHRWNLQLVDESDKWWVKLANGRWTDKWCDVDHSAWC